MASSTRTPNPIPIGGQAACAQGSRVQRTLNDGKEARSADGVMEQKHVQRAWGRGQCVFVGGRRSGTAPGLGCRTGASRKADEETVPGLYLWGFGARLFPFLFLAGPSLGHTGQTGAREASPGSIT